MYMVILNRSVPMRGEVDKNQNIHALKVGHQIMLCKKSTLAKENELVFLWPSTKICEIAIQFANKGVPAEECIYKKEKYEKHPCKNNRDIFLLSEDGAKYSINQKISQIWKENQKQSKHFATIEYRKIKPYFFDGTPNRELFGQLSKSKLFYLWDIDEGPLKLFTKKQENIRIHLTSGKIAIYRVYTIHGRKNVKIKHTDLAQHGLLPKLKIESHEKIIDYIETYGLDPVINDEKFDTFKNKLENIIDDYGGT